MSPFLLITRPNAARSDRVAGPDDSELERAIVATLKGSARLPTAVGAQVYPNFIPEGKQLPAITYQVVSRNEVMSADGPSGLASARVRFVSRSKSATEAAAALEAVRRILLPLRGRVLQTQIFWVAPADSSEDYAAPDDASDLGTYRRTMDLKFRYRVSIPT